MPGTPVGPSSLDPRILWRRLRGLLVALALPGALGAQGAPEGQGEVAPRPDPPGDRFASWVASRELVYASRDDRGEARTYSGRVYFPPLWTGPASRPVPLVVYVHATTEPTDIPLYNRGDEVMVGAMAACIHPMVVAMPDLPGYGRDASLRPHPYCHARSLATAVLDMIRPALGLLASERVWDGRVFLAGYSSGGYGALAAVKEWHVNPRYGDLPLTAAACMAGPFHVSEATRACLAEGLSYDRPDIQARLIQAYHDLYPETGAFAPERVFHRDLMAHRAQGPDAGNLTSWLEERCSGEHLRLRIQHRLKRQGAARGVDIMNPEWVKAHLDKAVWPDSEVGRRLRENDLVGGWHPRIPILLATSPTDDCVHPGNTYALLKDWRERGCTAPLHLYPLTLLGKGMGHAAAGTLAMEKAFRWFAGGAGKPRARL